MEKIFNQVIDKKYDDVETSLTTLSHKNYIKTTCQMSYIDFCYEKNNRIFMKLFKIFDDKPEFYTYGYLCKDGFTIDRSNIYVFKYNNLNKRINIRQDNNCYLTVVGENINYLLYNPYKEVVYSMYNKIIDL